MYRKKINAICIDNYDEDIRQIQQLEHEIRILEQHVLNVENRVRQKAAKRAEYELHIKGFDEDQRFDKNFWRELHIGEKTETDMHEIIQPTSPSKQSSEEGYRKQETRMRSVPEDHAVAYFFERVRHRLQ